MVSTPGVDQSLEAGEQTSQEKAAPPDPIQELTTRLENRLDATAQGIHDQMGYLGRQVEKLLRQPATSETRAEVAALREQVGELDLNLRLGAMDSDQRAAYLLEQRKVKPEPKPERQPEPEPESEQEWLAREFLPWQTLLKQKALKAGVNFDAVIHRQDWPKQFKRETGWPGFYEAAEESINNAADEAKRSAEPKPRADVQRGTAAARTMTWAEAQRISKISDLSDADYEKLIASG